MLSDDKDMVTGRCVVAAGELVSEGVQVNTFTGSQVYRCTLLQACRFTGVQVCRSITVVHCR